MIGKTLGHYQIVEKIGQGGMGVVYKARDTHLDRFVAIKVLSPERVADAERKARFVLEAKASSALNHPNIVTIHDISSEAGIDFIAMEHDDDPMPRVCSSPVSMMPSFTPWALLQSKSSPKISPFDHFPVLFPP